MTQEQFNKMMETYLAQQKTQQPEAWRAEARAWAEQNDIIAGDGSGNMQHKSACTREMMGGIPASARAVAREVSQKDKIIKNSSRVFT